MCVRTKTEETRQFVTATSALEMGLMTPGASGACVTPRKRSRHCDSKAKAAITIGGRRGPDALRHTIEQLQIRNGERYPLARRGVCGEARGAEWEEDLI